MKSVLIVKCGALGDVVRTTSLLEPLKKRYGGPIDWVTSPAALPLLEGLPQLRRAVAAGSPQAARLARDYDLALSLEEDAAAAELARRCCRGELVGVLADGGRLDYTPSAAAYYDMSLLGAEKTSLEAANGRKAANRRSYARLWLDILGLSRRGAAAPPPRLPVSEEDRRAARAVARRHGLGRLRPIGVNPGAGARWPSKQLSEEKSIRVLAALAGLGRPLLLLGGEDEAARNRRIAAALPAGAVARPEPLPLRVFAALIELCAALVVTDSLALHLATALRKPVVALVGPTSAAELDVFGRGEKLVPRQGCGCFYRPRCRRARHCLDGVPEARIVAAVRRSLR